MRKESQSIPGKHLTQENIDNLDRDKKILKDNQVALVMQTAIDNKLVKPNDKLKLIENSVNWLKTTSPAFIIESSNDPNKNETLVFLSLFHGRTLTEEDGCIFYKQPTIVVSVEDGKLFITKSDGINQVTRIPVEQGKFESTFLKAIQEPQPRTNL